MITKIERLTKSKKRISDLLFTATIELAHKQALVDELRFLERSLQELINHEMAKPKLNVVSETKEKTK